MKKSIKICWLIISVILILFSFIELSIGFSLWLKESHLNFWGPASITLTLIFIISLISLILSVIYLRKRKR